MPELISILNRAFAVQTAFISSGELVRTALLNGLNSVRGFRYIRNHTGVKLET